MIALRALGALLTYPNPALIDALPEIGAEIERCTLLARSHKERLAALIAELVRLDPYEREESYVALFDRGRTTSLNLFEHVHGESRERGQAMVDLGLVYERAGYALRGKELPDYLPVMLEYLSCRTLAETREMLGDCAHILRAVGERLAGRGSRYAAVFDALLKIAAAPGLAWSELPQPQPEPALDDEWIEQPAFGGAPGGRGQRPQVAVMQFVPPKRT